MKAVSRMSSLCEYVSDQRLGTLRLLILKYPMRSKTPAREFSMWASGKIPLLIMGVLSRLAAKPRKTRPSRQIRVMEMVMTVRARIKVS